MTDHLKRKVEIANAITRVRAMPANQRQVEFDNLAYHIINNQEVSNVPR